MKITRGDDDVNEQLQKPFQQVLQQWQRNQQAHILEGAEDEATLLEHHFYTFIEAFSAWFKTIDRPASLEEALALPDVQEIVRELPAPLYIPFENELDLLVDGIEQESDEKYD